MSTKNHRKDTDKIKAVMLSILSAVLFAAGPANGEPPESRQGKWIDPTGMTVESRVRVPLGFERRPAATGSFAAFLRSLPLKSHGAKVLLFNGAVKENRGIYDAVVDLKIGDKNLHQCADAVIRLRAEYLYEQRNFAKIHFNFSNGFRADYVEWMKGKRIAVVGNQAHWVQARPAADSGQIFWQFLETVFAYAGTLSLQKELQPVKLDDVRGGDVFIQGGSPGHALIVIDLAFHSRSGEKIFLLAQSYMPAQEIQILKNPVQVGLSPWYAANFGDTLRTPEWTFAKTDLRRFNERPTRNDGR